MRRNDWKAVLALLVLVVLTIWGAVLFARDKKLHLFFFDVGQGDAILVRQGQFEILIDGGPDRSILTHLGRVLPPWDRRIEIVVLTHPHADHVTGLVEVIGRYEVGEVWGTGLIHTSDIYRSFLTGIRDNGLSFRVVAAGDRYEYEDLAVTVLAPFRNLAGMRLDNANLGSIVLKLSYGNFAALLTGDAEETVQAALLDRHGDLTATVLKVPHQGSRDADLPAFVSAVRPQLAILSVGPNNRYGHPHAEVLQRYRSLNIPLLRTDRDGTVTLTTDGVLLWIRTGRSGIFERVGISAGR